MSIYDEDDDQTDFNNWLYNKPITNKPISPPIIKNIPPTQKEPDYPQPHKPKKIKYDSDGDEIEDDGYRNPGGGEGRPIQYDEKASKMTTIKFTPSQHLKYISLGGSTWVKKMLDGIKEK